MAEVYLTVDKAAVADGDGNRRVLKRTDNPVDVSAKEAKRLIDIGAASSDAPELPELEADDGDVTVDAGTHEPGNDDDS